MSAGLWRVRMDGQYRLARGESADRPTELLAPSLSVAGLLADPAQPLLGLESFPGEGTVPASAVIVAPLDLQPVWAAGVTFPRSRDARLEEAVDGGDVYDRVFAAERPELFFKAAGIDAIGTGDQLGIRADSGWNVPEPELAVVADPFGRLQAFVLGNDVSSRSIEGENPLYLPQAKVYERSCGIGPCLVPVSVAPAWDELRIEMQIVRASAVLYQDAMHLRAIRRTPSELLSWLFAAQSFAHGVALLTGTSLVPPSEITLLDGDSVTVHADGLGTLLNTIITVGAR
ncbi:MAG TPA: fumarylacetoacetate hydrolase family protein [Streptosporangiaceae bacterium]|nr:fumarylacetoacetate hydrolase family protein [Streptosporangiaceae bacterium]